MRGNARWVLLAALMLFAGRANAQCTKDTDCKGDRVCEAGKCTAPPPPSGAVAPPVTETTAPPAVNGGTDAPPSPAAPPATDAPAVGQALPPPTSPAAAPPPPPLAAEPAPLAPALPPEPKTHRRSKSAMIGGIVMVSVGPIALLGAVAARNSQVRCDDQLASDYPGNVLPPSERYRVDECNKYDVPIYVFGIGGAVLTAVGIPLIIYGAKSVPDPHASRALEIQPWATSSSGGVRLRLTL